MFYDWVIHEHDCLDLFSNNPDVQRDPQLLIYWVRPGSKTYTMLVLKGILPGTPFHPQDVETNWRDHD